MANFTVLGQQGAIYIQITGNEGEAWNLTISTEDDPPPGNDPEPLTDNMTLDATGKYVNLYSRLAGNYEVDLEATTVGSDSDDETGIVVT
jgi:hypothetical protein